MWQMGAGWGWWMALGMVSMILFWGLVIWAVYAVSIRREHRPAERARRDDGTALEMLQRRYARGKLTAAQFEEMRSRLLPVDGGIHNGH